MLTGISIVFLMWFCHLCMVLNETFLYFDFSNFLMWCLNLLVTLLLLLFHVKMGYVGHLSFMHMVKIHFFLTMLGKEFQKASCTLRRKAQKARAFLGEAHCYAKKTNYIITLYFMIIETSLKTLIIITLNTTVSPNRYNEIMKNA